MSYVGVDKDLTKQLLSNGDAQTFIDFFMPGEKIGQIPEFQQLLWDLFIAPNTSKNKIAIAVPRDHGKTTWAKLAAVYFFLFTDTRFIAYASNTHTVASYACSDIISFLNSPNFSAIFGKVEFLKYQDSSGYYQFRIGEKVCMLKAFGAGQQIRGINIDNARPDLAIVDDIEDSDEIKTKESKLKLRSWFFGTFYKALAEEFKIIMIGNMTAEDCLLADVCKLESWYSVIMSSLIKNTTTGKLEPIWPARKNMDKIREEYKEFQRMGILSRWYEEMMNMPVNLDSSLIDFTKVIYSPFPDLSEIQFPFVTIDPAFTQNTNSDDSAIVLHAFIPATKHWQVLEYHYGKYSVNEVFNITLALMQKYKTTVIGLECNAAQRVLRLIFETYFANHHINNFDIIEIYNHKQKIERILGWCAYLESGTYHLNAGEQDIVSQLLNYNTKSGVNRDDLIDSCSMGVYIIENHFPALVSQANLNIRQSMMKINAQTGAL